MYVMFDIGKLKQNKTNKQMNPLTRKCIKNDVVFLGLLQGNKWSLTSCFYFILIKGEGLD